MSRGHRVVVFAFACLGMVTVAWSGELRHTVKSGESVSGIARDYYGDYRLAHYLILYNGTPGSNIQVGEELRIPYAEWHVIRSGDTWSALTQRHVGRASAYPAVAVLNGLEPDAALVVGGRILFPAVVTHELARGESLAVLAERFYGDADRTDVLTLFNGVEDPRRLSVGQAVEVPLVSLQLKEGAPARQPEVAQPQVAAKRSSPTGSERKREPKPAAPPKEDPAAPMPAATAVATPEVKREPVVVPTARFGQEITSAVTSYEAGEFGQARDLLESLRQPVEAHGSDSERGELLRTLAFVYVAYDMAEQACAAYRSAPHSPRQAQLDPDTVSPKIRNVLSGCGRQATSHSPAGRR